VNLVKANPKSSRTDCIGFGGSWVWA